MIGGLRAVVTLDAGMVLMANGDRPRAAQCLKDAAHTVQEMHASPVELHLSVLDALRPLRVRHFRSMRGDSPRPAMHSDAFRWDDVEERSNATGKSTAKSPLQGRVVPELLSQDISQNREVVVSPWRVIYGVEESRVLVVSVIDSRRNVEDILLGRFLNRSC